MLSFPNCKINLGLNVVSKRTDGFHNLETVFYPIQLHDALEAVHAPSLQFTATGLQIDGDAESNLCLKAYQLLRKDFKQITPLHIHLHKVIPMGAGLGGGSSNGAFMLSLLNRKFQLQLTQEQLIHYALQLGSDCPFFIINQPSFATGRGEILEPVDVNLSAYKILIVNPGVHVSTREAFSGLTPQTPAKPIKLIIQQPVASWKDELVNDFEKTIFPIHPTIENIKEQLYNMGAVYASMTGTGSTVFGIFNKEELPALNVFDSFFVKWV
jgi:4-diphosphocytidyl-2-C-methyl-D-erythritol kinase